MREYIWYDENDMYVGEFFLTKPFEEYEKDALTHCLLKPGESVKVTNPTIEYIILQLYAFLIYLI